MTRNRLHLSRPARLGLSLLLCGAIGALLAATIYWTMFHPAWTAFLGGVLFAALASIASQASKAQWALARRVRQVERMRQRCDEANARSAAATAAFQAAEHRLRCLGDVLRSAVLFVDRDHVCRFHNAAAAAKLGAKGAELDGRPLRELVGELVYSALRPRLESSLAGEAASYELAWATPTTEQTRYAVRQLASAAPVPEVCLLATPVQSELARAAPADLTHSGEHGEVLYLRALAQELTGWDDPKAKLRHALDQDRFLLVQQEIRPLDLAAPDPLAAEVLLRLQEEEDNLLPPGGFLPDAERLGMMEELDRWVVRNVVTHCLRQQPGARGCTPVYFVNLSAAAVRSAEFVRYVQAQIDSRKADGRSLCFELGEHDVASLNAEARRLIDCLKPYGCRFTVDAFGSAKGSFAPLRGLAFDFLKIDGVLVQNMLRDPAARARITAINTACHRIGMRTIAEFVEDDVTLAALRRIGVDYVQGFGIGRPVPLSGPPARATEAA
jgi:EAL domain-containing protein (putative c-di-GMP-specific phosphodiesterase class I)/PAS domain-containing protein